MARATKPSSHNHRNVDVQKKRQLVSTRTNGLIVRNVSDLQFIQVVASNVCVHSAIPFFIYTCNDNDARSFCDQACFVYHNKAVLLFPLVCETTDMQLCINV